MPPDALVDALWGDDPPARPGDQLAVLASRLRRELGRDRIERTDTGYRLDADWLDLSELDAVVAEAERRHAAGEIAGAVSAARVGLALVRGPVPEPRNDAPWAMAEHAPPYVSSGGRGRSPRPPSSTPGTGSTRSTWRLPTRSPTPSTRRPCGR